MTRTKTLLVAIGMAAALSISATFPVAAASTAGIVPPNNPSQSLSPSPDFSGDGACAGGVLDDTATCNADANAAINHARALLESLFATALNLKAFGAMTLPQQIFVITNLERVQRGLPAMVGLTKQLDATAQAGANNGTDPNLTSSTLTGGAQVVGWGSNWAAGTSNPLGADYYFMYDDGYGGINGSCTSPSAPGCWGHRDNILGTFTNQATCTGYGLGTARSYMGAGFSRSGSAYGPSFTEILVGACGSKPTDVVFTWARALQLLHG